MGGDAFCGLTLPATSVAALLATAAPLLCFDAAAQGSAAAAHIRAAALFAAFAAAAVAVWRLARPAAGADAVARRSARVDEAVRLGAAGEGVTREWYAAADTAFARARVAVLCAFVAAVAAAVYAAWPAPALRAAGELLGSAWRNAAAHHSPERLFFLVNVALYLGVFWGWSILFAVLGWSLPKTLAPFKIQPAVQLSGQYLLWGVKVGVMNCVIVVASLYALSLLYPRLAPGAFSDELPSLGEVAVHFACSFVIADAMFFFPHWFMHANQWAFDNIHYVHHQIESPSAIHAIYAHPVEFIIGNMPVFGAGPILLGSHCTFWWIWITFAVTQTCIAHSGFQLPLFSSPNQFHDYHHANAGGPSGYQNFGILGLCDALFQTMAFYQQKTYQRTLANFYGGADYPVDRFLAERGQAPSPKAAPAELPDPAHLCSNGDGLALDCVA